MFSLFLLRGRAQRPGRSPVSLLRIGLRLGCRTEGSALVEMYLVVPIVLMLILGMFSFGLVLNSYLMLTSANGAGTRALALSRGQTTPALAATDPCQYAVSVLLSSEPTFNNAAGSMTFDVQWSRTTTSTTDGSTSTQTADYPAGSCPGLALNSGDNIQLTTTYPAPLVLYGWRSGSISLRSVTAELVE